jgi:hypothetical protein
VYAMNGEPLTRHQGAPLRLIVPGWYGVANVKWLSQVHIQEDPYLGKFQARWYRTLKGEMIDGEMKLKETAVTHMQLKSFIARVTREAERYKVLGVVLKDGTALKSVEVRVDDGLWQPGHDGSFHEREVFMEVVHLHLERRHPGRTYTRLPGDRRQWKNTADRRGPRNQEIIPGR